MDCEGLRREMSEHQDYVELCALYASGSISEGQYKLLENHLNHCGDCRRSLEEFQEVISMGLPALAPNFADARIEPSSDESAQRRLLARIEQKIVATQLPGSKRVYARYAA